MLQWAAITVSCPKTAMASAAAANLPLETWHVKIDNLSFFLLIKKEGEKESPHDLFLKLICALTISWLS